MERGDRLRSQKKGIFSVEKSTEEYIDSENMVSNMIEIIENRERLCYDYRSAYEKLAPYIDKMRGVVDKYDNFTDDYGTKIDYISQMLNDGSVNGVSLFVDESNEASKKYVARLKHKSHKMPKNVYLAYEVESEGVSVPFAISFEHVKDGEFSDRKTLKYRFNEYSDQYEIATC